MSSYFHNMHYSFLCAEHKVGAPVLVKAGLGPQVGEEHHVLLVKRFLGLERIVKKILVDLSANVAPDLVGLILGQSKNACKGGRVGLLPGLLLRILQGMSFH